MHYQYYSALNTEKRRLARERAIAWKVIKTTIKTFLVLGVATALSVTAFYFILIWAVDGQIDYANTRECEAVKGIQVADRWAKLQSECQQYYETNDITYMRQYHPELDN